MSEPTATESAKKEEANLATPETGQQEPDFFARMESLLNDLAPPDSLTITTCKGEKLVLPGSIPARRQIKVFRLMKELMSVDSVMTALAGMQSAEHTGALVTIVVSLATDEDVANLIGKIFSEAYPDECAGVDPLDFLPIEEIVVSLLPFSERFVKKLGTGVVTLGKNASRLN